jgi:hypothetical protein
LGPAWPWLVLTAVCDAIVIVLAQLGGSLAAAPDPAPG